MPLFRLASPLFPAILLCWSASIAAAQPPSLRVERLEAEQGVPLSHIVAMMQDSRGFVWMGGYAGLFRYDGYKVVHYVNEGSDSLSIGDNRVTVIAESANGRGLWIGTQNNLNYYDRHKEIFTRYFQAQSSSSALGRKYISSLCELESGQLLLLQDLEAGIFDPTNHKYRMLEKRTDENAFHQVLRAKDGTVWVGANNGLFKLNATNQTLEAVSLSGLDTIMPIYALAESAGGLLWLGSRNGIIRYAPHSGQARFHALAGEEPTLFRSVLPARDGNIWCGAENGLFRYNPQTLRSQHFTHQRLEPYSLSNNLINALFEDRSGLIWAGTAAGINVIKPFTGAFKRWPNNYQYETTRPSQFRSFFEIAPGQLLLWEKDGLMVLNRQDGSLSPFPYLPAQKEAWNTGIYAFFKDRQGRIWMGSHGGLFAFDPETKGFTHYHKDSGGPLALSSNIIRDINQDRDGAIWIATWDGGVNMLDEQAGRVYHFFNTEAHKKTYQNGARRIFVDSRGTVWIGTRGGLHRYDKRTGSFKRFTHDPGNPHSIGENTAFDICEDEKGFLWIGTYGGGLNRFDPKKETFKRFTLKDGLPDNNVFSVSPDGMGRLWLSTFVGIVKFDLQSERVVRILDYRDGLLNKNFDAFSHYRSPYTGELFFEGKQGLDVFHPGDVRPDTTLPVIRFTNFQLFNRPVRVRQDDKRYKRGEYLLEEAITETNKIVLPYNYRGVMTFEFAALHFANPDLNQYAYFLQHYDKEWQPIGNRRTVTFTNLSHGQYTLRVKASNADGVWNEEGIAMEIVILPPWWLTWWAYGLYALMIIGMIYALLLFQRRRWREQAELAERQREAAHLKELDEFRKQLYDNVTHEFRTPLTVIIGLAENMLAEGDSRLELIRRNGYRLLQIVNQILDLSKLEAGMLPFHMMQGDVVAFLKYLTHSYASLAGSKKIAINFEATPNPLPMDFDEEKLHHIYSNLLSNAIKFTPEGGAIFIHAAQVERTGKPFLQIEVRDTGTGIPEDQLPRIFDRFYQVTSDNARQDLRREVGTGIGLTLTKELAELLGGAIEAESKAGKGACFRVYLPITYQAPLRKEDYFLAPAHTAALPVDEDMEAVPPGAGRALPALLIVEDSPDIVTYLRSSFQGQYRILTAGNGREGLKKAIQEVPDLIISDVMMPEMDGFELCEALKSDQRTSHVPIVLLTAKASAEDRMAGLQRGADAYLPKPFSLAELQLQMANLIAMQQRLRARYLATEPPLPTDDPALQIEDQFLAKANQAIMDHLGDASFSTPEMCRVLGVSRTQLHNKIKALTGRSAGAYIKLLRLRRAQELLRTTKRNVSQIAYEVGFNDPGFFSRCYREEFGLSPKQEQKG